MSKFYGKDSHLIAIMQGSSKATTQTSKAHKYPSQSSIVFVFRPDNLTGITAFNSNVGEYQREVNSRFRFSRDESLYRGIFFHASRRA